MPPVARTLLRFGSRLGATAQNALEVARFGGLDTADEDASPCEVVTEQRIYRLRHYFPGAAGDGDKRPVMLLVPPLMISSEVYDISSRVSAVAELHRRGVDPWVVDFGAPEREPGGLERTVTDHVLAVSDAIDRVREATGRDVHLAGYSQGGMFVYQAAAYRRSRGIESLVTFGSPADTSVGLPFGLPSWLAAEGAERIPDALLRSLDIPGWVTRTGFQLLSPVKSVRSRIDFLMQLHDRERLAPRERQRRFLEREGWVAWPGPALAEFIRQFIQHNRMLTGGFVIGDRLVTLADITCPVLTFVGEVDEIAPPPMVRGIRRAAPRAQIHEVSLRAGHFGLVVGSVAMAQTWPVVADWARWRAGAADLPEPVTTVTGDEEAAAPALPGGAAGYGLQLVAGIGGNAVRSAATTAVRAVRGSRQLFGEAAQNLPRLARLERIQSDTRISLGLLLDEQARRVPQDVFFLYHGRAHTHDAARRRVDAVVRGLIHIGVRQGDAVGVLMSTRPSALALVAALSRIGAVAVLLRPDGDPEREAALSGVTRVIADPEHAERAARLPRVRGYVLGGGGGPDRDLALPLAKLGLEDMERIDPEAVALPGWYRPNPGRAGDVAYVLFTGDGEHLKASRVTNRRWALSAFGTASSASLSPADTVFSITPLQHPSAILMSLGGAVVSGARLALASAYDPETFWDEARRYGATVASYTWSLLNDLVNAPPHPGERHHPVRLFIGSGMPRGLWRRVEERFAPARVLEFYASTTGEAILVNLSGKKPGSLGRPLPGSAEVRLARYDLENGRLAQGPDGFAVECDPEEIGMLLSRVRPAAIAAAPRPVRGVFAPGDAWTITGDLFRRDADGDFWLVGREAELIRAAEGIVPPGPIRDALGDLPYIDAVAVYGVDVNGTELAAAAVSLCGDERLKPLDLSEALLRVEPELRPAVVRVVDRIPLTVGHRLDTRPLRAEGIPGADGRTYFRDRTGAYRPLTETARRRLLKTAPPRTASR
ncbi:acyl-CoA synthetase [Actinomadura kijaniata]|uniref:Putative long chain acyl-CoA synthase n=1 Tax=Actinomadura namibiensis TaxID=182080 RepID=A0A7W3LIR4_ACTNM|nr:alpha/beta fold hydrolase [Actinomadura namibiensis]MBA8948891.1 putative long chain acyl-CoA synthase [Actinomadura namibiensis]